MVGHQLRLLWSAAAYVLIEAIRRLGLDGTELARAQVSTIRLILVKIGTVILRNTRRIRFLFSSAYPYQALFALVLRRLAPQLSHQSRVPRRSKADGGWG